VVERGETGGNITRGGLKINTQPTLNAHRVEGAGIPSFDPNGSPNHGIIPDNHRIGILLHHRLVFIQEMINDGMQILLTLPLIHASGAIIPQIPRVPPRGGHRVVRGRVREKEKGKERGMARVPTQAPSNWRERGDQARIRSLAPRASPIGEQEPR